MSVSGSWRIPESGFGERAYLELFAESDQALPWFRVPQDRGDRIELQTVEEPPATVTNVRASISKGHGGRLSFKGSCNPTRTLSHLLALRGEEQDFIAAITEMPTGGFFALGPVPRSLDNKDNWLPDLDLAHERLGSDVFGAFLPIFVEKFQRFVLDLFAPVGGGFVHDRNGTDAVGRAEGCEVRLSWATAKAPQAEAYFERYHSRAIGAVRAAAQTVLDAANTASVRHHLPSQGFERAGDMFSITAELTKKLKLAIYAKGRDRLRFEARRNDAGRYRGARPVRPADRLMNIFDTERANLLTAYPWASIGEMLEEHSVPVPGDLEDFLRFAISAAERSSADISATLTTLFLDGGLSRTSDNQELITALVKGGVIEQRRVRRRNGRLPHRYALTDRFQAMQREILTALSGSDLHDP